MKFITPIYCTEKEQTTTNDNGNKNKTNNNKKIHDEQKPNK